MLSLIKAFVAFWMLTDPFMSGMLVVAPDLLLPLDCVLFVPCARADGRAIAAIANIATITPTTIKAYVVLFVEFAIVCMCNMPKMNINNCVPLAGNIVIRLSKFLRL